MKTKIKVAVLLAVLIAIISDNALSQRPTTGVVNVIVAPDHINLFGHGLYI